MKILVADDHTLFRDTLIQYISRMDMETDVDVSKDFDEAYAFLKKNGDYDLVLLDLKMPGMSGMQGLKKIRNEFPDLKVGLMSGVAEKQDVEQAMELGAIGYFPKTMSGKALIGAIKKVITTSEVFIPLGEDNDEIMPAYYTDDPLAELTNGKFVDGKGNDMKLTPREKEVLGFLSHGASNKEIANELGLQVVTVKLHVRGLCRKLEASNRTQAVMKAVQLGLVSGAKAM